MTIFSVNKTEHAVHSYAAGQDYLFAEQMLSKNAEQMLRKCLKRLKCLKGPPKTPLIGPKGPIGVNDRRRTKAVTRAAAVYDRQLNIDFH